MKIYRAIIDQPSTLQPYHHLDGRSAIAVDDGGPTVTLHFTEGNVDRMEVLRQSVRPSHRDFVRLVPAKATISKVVIDAPSLQDIHGKTAIAVDTGGNSVDVHYAEGPFYSSVLPRNAVAAFSRETPADTSTDNEVLEQFKDLIFVMSDAWTVIHCSANGATKTEWMGMMSRLSDYAEAPRSQALKWNEALYALLKRDAGLILANSSRDTLKIQVECVLTKHAALDKPVAPATKLVELRLSAMTRVEYTEVVEVPADITAEELVELTNRRYQSVDGGEFTQDPDYWERGDCYTTQPTEGALPTVVARRDASGCGLSIGPARPHADEVPDESHDARAALRPASRG